MARFIAERTLPDGVNLPATPRRAQTCLRMLGDGAESCVTWLHSYVTRDKTKTFCVYDGPDEAAIRKAAQSDELPIDAVTPVSVFDPYFYQ